MGVLCSSQSHGINDLKYRNLFLVQSKAVLIEELENHMKKLIEDRSGERKEKQEVLIVLNSFVRLYAYVQCAHPCRFGRLN